MRTISAARFISAVFFALCVTTAMLPARAADTLIAPFRVPFDWIGLSGSILPKSLLSWSNAEGSQIDTRSYPADAAGVLATFDNPPGAIGKRLSSEKIAICGASDAGTVLRFTGDRKTTTVIVESIDGRTLTTMYSRPAGLAEDAGIVSSLEGACDLQRVAALSPPAGWTSDAAQTLGNWFGISFPANAATAPETGAGSAEHAVIRTRPVAAQPSLRLISFAPGLESGRIARVALDRFLSDVDPSVVSTENVRRCGNPATEYRASGKSAGKDDFGVDAQPIDIRIDVVQSSTAAYALMYAHPASQPEDRAALDSLATLCASGHPISATAAESALLPFNIPLGWTSSPAFTPKQIVTWKASDGSTLEIQRFPLGLGTAMNAMFSGQEKARADETVLDAHDPCGHPRTTVASKPGTSAKSTFTLETLGKYTYYVLTSLQDTAPSKDAIASLVDSTCDPQTLVYAQPPAGWKRIDESGMIATFFDTSRTSNTSNNGVQSQLQLFELPNNGELKDAIRTILDATVPDSDARVVTTTESERCGGSSLEARATASVETLYGRMLSASKRSSSSGVDVAKLLKDADVAKGPLTEPVDIRIVLTKSASSAYALIYTHPTEEAASEAVTQSLATLCAY